MESASRATLHLYAPFPLSTPTPRTFLEALASFGNPSLWEGLSVDGDGEWILQGLSQGTLVIAHDGSYMPEDLVDLCSAGVVMYCKASKN
jgi:hypothetical protein